MTKASWVFQLDNDPRAIQRILGEGIKTSVFPGEQVMLSVVRVEPHASGRIHSHPEEQWGVLLEGKCTGIQNSEVVECEVGEFWYSPGGSVHGIRPGDSPAVLLDIFSPPRAEYKQAGSGFGAAKVEE